MSEQLTAQQKMAVENRGGNLLVAAAAGSGKTKVLVERLMSYLTDPINPANVDDFLIITYTKAAAAELRGKISDKLVGYISENPENKHMQQQIQRLYLSKISTVHAFCADILREYAYRLDIPADFRIAEENECQELMYQVLQQVLDDAYLQNIDEEAFRVFIDTQGLGRDDRQIPEIVLQVYTSALCHKDPNAWLDWCLESCRPEHLQDASETLWGEYLIADLKQFLRWQIESFQNCMETAMSIPGMEKPVALFHSTVDELTALMECRTWDQIVKHPPIAYGTLTFKKDLKDSDSAMRMKAVRNACKEELAKKLQSFADESKVVLHNLRDVSLAAEGLIQMVKEFRSRYDKQKKVRRILDFSDIEQRMLDLLLGKQRTGVTSAAEEIGSRFREIMVDEYQDSNEVQDAIFSALTMRRNNCFMVGDVKQSIYQFRLADPGIFLNKYNRFRPAENAKECEERKVLLSSNFRSSGGVISAVNDVFTECMSDVVGDLQYGESEKLREGIPHIPLGESEVELYGIEVKEDTYEEEAAFVAQRIQQLLDGSHMVRHGDELRPITVDDIVILLRSPGSVGGEFRFALESAGIPCTIGSDIDLLQTPEVDTLRSILQIIHNPTQDIPLISALVSPVFCFTADDLALIRRTDKFSSFYTVLQKHTSPKAESFLSVLSALRMDARFLSTSQLIHQVFFRTGMLSIYAAMDNGEEAVKNLQDFCQIATEYENTGRKDLSYFLDYLQTLEEKGLSVSGSASTGAVRIMSIHKSKGLEFPVVFLCGLSRSLNTSDLQKQVLCHKNLGLGLNSINTKQRVRFPTIAKYAISRRIHSESVSEELRVLYVAMTRARDRLIMTYASPKLEDRLSDLALRMGMCPKDLLHSSVSCPGCWVLMTALKRTEAGEFFHISNQPTIVSVQDQPWSIHVVQVNTDAGTEKSLASDDTENLSEECIQKIKRGLQFCYPYDAAVSVPSKLTATQMKGRLKDQEAAEFTDASNGKHLDFRKPNRSVQSSGGTEYGNAMHAVMQHLNFRVCTHPDSIKEDIKRICDAGLITKEQQAIVDADRIYRFFATSMGKKLITGQVLREFKFSILDDAQTYYANVTNEKILLQGVVDCALIEQTGLTVLDFKTDYITEANLEAKIREYRAQVSIYGKALARIYERPVTGSYIYFFSSEQLVKV